jgi:hypothetical protein
MPNSNWRKTITIDHFIYNGCPPQEAARNILNAIRREAGKDGQAWLQDLEACADDPDLDVNTFNDILEQVYDWADERRIWLGE